MSAVQTTRDHDEVGILPVATMVLWAGCLGVGAAGLLLHYPRPRPLSKEPAPVEARVMHVELTPQLSPAPQAGPAAPAGQPPAISEPQPPSPPAAVMAPSAPPLVAVAIPSPAIAFAVPVEGPTRIVDAKQAIPPPRSPAPATQQAPIQTAPPAPDGPQKLTFGQGEGRQPAPEYPREAAFAHQQGTVIIRFTVGEDGNVQNAQVAIPCPYAMLNHAALRAVRDTWRFAPGLARSYEVPIEFQLVKR